MSYDGVVVGKLKLKGRALDVSGTKKKKKKPRRSEYVPTEVIDGVSSGGDGAPGEGEEGEDQDRQDLYNRQRQQQQQQQQRRSLGGDEEEEEEGRMMPAVVEDHRTPAEKRYHEQKAKLEETRLAKMASKSHRQRVEEFNQYLANLSEHYDIPKVGPG
ncbi:protein FAM32A [Selaginella moellendorffii]|uniref:protein FAM32A n=1 Tax=Selaginella moellendorffii TaxID=88036 RepID=UPI000D1D0438|nr:protein FAM32A [Selaginella moellendorffii]|eukprot:XP_024535746.1 protein FAM32A [Selaginella moellendorffii]